jgi:hypothetical protein
VKICAHDNGTGGFANLHFDQLDLSNPKLSDTLKIDEPGYDCSLPALPAITVPGA